jgi:hypothetical protein
MTFLGLSWWRRHVEIISRAELGELV